MRQGLHALIGLVLITFHDGQAAELVACCQQAQLVMLDSECTRAVAQQSQGRCAKLTTCEPLCEQARNQCVSVDCLLLLQTCVTSIQLVGEVLLCCTDL